MKPVVCFGEILWDLLPRGRFLGGAPLNVAYHLAQLGVETRLVSAVGRDALGEEALASLVRAGLSTAGVSTHATLPTGTVEVSLDAAGQAAYRIHEPVAWDAIATGPHAGTARKWAEAGEPPAAVIFGSLALRSRANREVLREWLATLRGGLRVCDLNLRAPHDDVATVEEFLRGLDVLKVNADEASRLMPPGLAGASVGTQAAQLAAAYDARVVCITLGGDGALLRHRGRTYRVPAPAVTVRDTIGAGDAFTAALLAGLLRPPAGVQPDWKTLLARACALGAFVAGCDGAQPAHGAASRL